MESFLWKIGGEAGFGIMTTGVDFCKLAAAAGYHVASYAEYPSLIRGGHNTFEVHISSKKIRSSKNKIDLLVCLNANTYELHRERLALEARIIYDKDSFSEEDQKQIGQSQYALHVPFTQILQEQNGSAVMLNTIAMGASLATLQWNIDDLYARIEAAFASKGKAVVQSNRALAKSGYDYVVNNYAPQLVQGFKKKPSAEPQMIISGNDAFSLGTTIADCRLYCAYPMTPTSTVLTTLAQWVPTTGMVVRHAEDEISVVSTALGGSFAGIRAACGTSGGGFALMNESISFAGIMEAPLVIFLGQRPGPATGLPTWTEQGDLLYAVHAGHGEFPKIVLAPGDVEEMYTLVADAFNLADIYQTPVIVMGDKHLCESYWSSSKLAFSLFAKGAEIERGKITHRVDESPYLRYKITDDGISPMLIPGQKERYFQANSYEHDESGHTTEEAADRQAQVDKRNKKTATYLKNHFKPPQVFGNLDEAELIFVSWGSNKGVILDALDQLAENGKKAAYIHFSYVFPLEAEAIRPLFAHRARYVLVENNSQAQFGRLLRQETGIDIQEKYLKYNGRQIFVEELGPCLKKIVPFA